MPQAYKALCAGFWGNREITLIKYKKSTYA